MWRERRFRGRYLRRRDRATLRRTLRWTAVRIKLAANVRGFVFVLHGVAWQLQQRTLTDRCATQQLPQHNISHRGTCSRHSPSQCSQNHTNRQVPMRTYPKLPRRCHPLTDMQSRQAGNARRPRFAHATAPHTTAHGRSIVTSSPRRHGEAFALGICSPSWRTQGAAGIELVGWWH